MDVGNWPLWVATGIVIIAIEVGLIAALLKIPY